MMSSKKLEVGLNRPSIALPSMKNRATTTGITYVTENMVKFGRLVIYERRSRHAVFCFLHLTGGEVVATPSSSNQSSNIRILVSLDVVVPDHNNVDRRLCCC